MSACRILILAFITIAVCVAGASAGTANTVTIADATMQPGTVQDVPIRLLSSTGVGGVSVTLTFSPAIVNVTNVVAGDFNIFIPDHSDVGNGILRVACTKPGHDMTGDLVIAMITLGAVGDGGSCELGLRAELTDQSGVAVPSSVDNGMLTVGSGAVTPDDGTNKDTSDDGDSPAASTPTVAPTSTSASTVTVVVTATTTATAAKTAAPVATAAATPETTTAPAAGNDETMPKKHETTGLPGFEGAIAIAGLLAIGYVMMRQKR